MAHCLEEQNVASDFMSDISGTPNAPERSSARGRQGAALQDFETRLKRLARELASEVREGVFVGFAPQSTYYTGLSYLFDQPEFESMDLVRHIGDIMDNLDKIVAELFEEVAPGVQVYVGEDSPFGAQCGTVLLRGGEAEPMMGVLGPMRMDYDRTIAMMKALQNIL